MNYNYKCITFNKQELNELIVAIRYYDKSVFNSVEHMLLLKIEGKLGRKLDELNQALDLINGDSAEQNFKEKEKEIK